MKRLLILLALLSGCTTMSHIQKDHVVRYYTTDAGDTLVLTNLPCTTMAGTFATVPPAERNPDIKAAKITWQGKAYDACWLKMEGLTIVLDELGDAGAVEGSAFDPPLKQGMGL